MAVTITITTPNIGTTLVRVQAADSTWTTLVSLTRSDPWGNVLRVRGAAGQSLVGGVVIVEDAEAPLDVDVTYAAVVSKGSSTQSGQATVHIPTDYPGRVILADANSPATMSYPHVESLADLTRPGRVGIYEVLDRVNPVIITGKLGGRQGTLILLTADQDETDYLWDLLNTGHVLLFRTTRTYGIGVLYFAIQDMTESRVTRLGMVPIRRFTLEFIETDPPVGPALSVGWNNWQRVKDNNTTWQGVLDTRTTWEKVLTDPYGVVPVPGSTDATVASAAG